MHTTQEWYKTYRTRGEKPARALYLARLSRASEAENEALLSQLSSPSRARVERFVDDFIRSREVECLTSERDSDFYNDPERAARVHKAAEYGSDGKYHAEVIQDWRDAFSAWVRDRKSWAECQRFTAAVEASFTATELWHEFNGSLDQEIG
jgi:hypothetical protein